MASVIDPATTIGSISLTVANLARSLEYYQHNIGLAALEHAGDSAILGVGARQLVRLRELPDARLIRRATGLYHFALRVPSRRDLARVIRNLAETATPLDGASDHLVSEALYLSDPDGHGIEIYCDRPRNTWYDEQGRFRMDTLRLDIDGILNELATNEPAWDGLPDGADMGHVHLQVADLAAAERFYIDLLGFERMIGMGSASFISAGGYHHHIGMNTWAGVGVPPPPASAARLLSYEIGLPSTEALGGVLKRLRAAGVPLAEQAGGWALQDPSHNTVILRASA